MSENLMNSAHKGTNQASRAGHDQIVWDGGEFEGVSKDQGPPQEYIRCPKCSLRHMAIMERCPVCKR